MPLCMEDHLKVILFIEDLLKCLPTIENLWKISVYVRYFKNIYLLNPWESLLSIEYAMKGLLPLENL